MILLGQQLKIYTAHKNITCKKFNNYCILRWRLILKEYSPDIEYIPGTKNIAADVLSQLTNNGNQNTKHESVYTMETMSELYNSE